MTNILAKGSAMAHFPRFLRIGGKHAGPWALLCVGISALVPTLPAWAAQVDIPTPLGSVAFGTSVTALSNGNFVVTDPGGQASAVGAAYLYSPNGALISTLTGSHTNDHVGSGGVVVVGDGNFVVISPEWNNVGVSTAGAVTWVNGTTGLSGVVSPTNSLVGTTSGDSVGSAQGIGVTTLSNGNYVVRSSNWNDGVAGSHVGAATWGNGSSGVMGPVSVDNSLVGTTTGDQVALDGVTALSNGNYVVRSPTWNNGVPASNFGAATWGDGTSGTTGPVSASNSLIGTTGGDRVGDAQGNGVTALTNSNYVVASSYWNNGIPGSNVGAATWGDGSSGVVGPVSAENSLVGSTPGDQVGSYGVTALSNGNYVVNSPSWNNGLTASNVGAATWGDGGSGITGPVSPSNSLVGTTAGDQVGALYVTALSNGNYVVASPDWSNGLSHVGAATWGDGNSGITGAVSISNSLVGTTPLDYVGFGFPAALANGNFVVESSSWNNAAGGYGAATWGNGSIGVTGPVSASNSLIGTANEYLGSYGVTALSNGNYVVDSPDWNGGVPGKGFGAATWCDGNSGATGLASENYSLVGTTTYDFVGLGYVTALSNGNYVVASPDWNNGMAGSNVGAVTWGNGNSGSSGTISSSNSLVGTTLGDHVGINGVTALSDGNYVIFNPDWNNGVAGSNVGAVTLANGGFRVKGVIQSWNSVLGAAFGGGASMVYAYDPVRKQLIVGRPADNLVTLLTMDQVFGGDFDP